MRGSLHGQNQKPWLPPLAWVGPHGEAELSSQSHHRSPTTTTPQDFETNDELKYKVISFLEEVMHDPELLTQERKAAANIIRYQGSATRLGRALPGWDGRTLCLHPCGQRQVCGQGHRPAQPGSAEAGPCALPALPAPASPWGKHAAHVSLHVHSCSHLSSPCCPIW